MANGQATAKTRARAEKAKAMMEAVFRDAVQSTLEIAQTPRSAGGQMRIDTGWLRGSLVAQIGEGAPAATANPYDAQEGLKITYNAGPTSLVIARAKVTDTITAYWTANYARPREYEDGFRRLAAQRWPQTVALSIKAAKAAMK